MRIFAYGSLVARPGERAMLPRHRRTWGAAMDNAVALPGYKRYLDPATGAHPDVRVAFLALAPDPAPRSMASSWRSARPASSRLTGGRPTTTGTS